MCALHHSESSSSASARSAIWVNPSGVASSHRTIREKPYFIIIFLMLVLEYSPDGLIAVMLVAPGEPFLQWPQIVMGSINADMNFIGTGVNDGVGLIQH